MNTKNNETAGASSPAERAVALRNAADNALLEADARLRELRALAEPLGISGGCGPVFERFALLTVAAILIRDAEAYLHEISPFWLSKLVDKGGTR